jgi:Pyruvate/2-oxoacid:ferredoxin oxidoreductase gamma subunit
MVTGIGGQGIQLATLVLARAAMAEGREVMLFGSYGGMMRGGNTDATLVLADGPIEAPPVVSSTWSAILMHHDYWTGVRARLVPGSLVVVNTSVFEDPGGPTGIDRDAWDVVELPATDLAVDVGSIMTASLVILGAYAGLTGIVGLDALRDAVEQALPPYRRQHVAVNHRALEVGHAAVPAGTRPAWTDAPSRAPERATTGAPT